MKLRGTFEMPHKILYWDGNIDAMYESIFDVLETEKVKLDDSDGIIRIKAGYCEGEIVVHSDRIEVDLRANSTAKAMCVVMLCFVWGLIPILIIYSLLSSTPNNIIRNLFKKVAVISGDQYDLRIPWNLSTKDMRYRVINVRKERHVPYDESGSIRDSVPEPVRNITPEPINPPQLGTSSNTVSCPNCDVVSPKDIAFCPNCGRFLQS